MTQNESPIQLQEQPKSAGDAGRDASIGAVVDFLSAHMQRMPGCKTPWEVLYESYADSWAEGPGDTKPLSAAEFGAALAHICKRANIRVKKTRSRVWCVGVRLIDPGVKALPAPAQVASPQT